jgi:hypothetical protein
MIYRGPGLSSYDSARPPPSDTFLSARCHSFLVFLCASPVELTDGTKLNSIPLSLRLRGIKFDILTPNQHIKSSLELLMDWIFKKLILGHI